MFIWACSVLLLLASTTTAASPVAVPTISSAKPPGLPAFLSLSLEFRSFPLFAGNKSAPNEFSINLLQNLGRFQGGHMPVIRVGGNSQDRAIFDPTLETPTAQSCSADPTAIQCIGPSYFDSYGTFPDTLYSHGFNLAWNNASGYSTLKTTVTLACKAIGTSLAFWEYGNEPDLYRGKWRPADWSVEAYATEWLNGTAAIKQYLQQTCPSLASPKFIAPSYSSPGSALNYNATWAAGINREGSIALKCTHNYITGATSPGVTLQGTLMNHTRTLSSLASHVRAAAFGDPIPYVIGECNSLYGGGAAGLSDVFGAALWVMDFTLAAAATGSIARLHYHQSVGAPYTAWTPVAQGSAGPMTNAPYYGKLAAVKMLGDSGIAAIVEVPVSSTGLEIGYAAYEGRKLVRLALLNMIEYNSTSTTARPSKTYSFALGKESSGSQWMVERLMAPGSEVKAGVTFGGYAYEYSSLGKPVRAHPNCTGLTVQAEADGLVTVNVADSQAIVLTLLS